jgi:hypothetical protein
MWISTAGVMFSSAVSNAANDDIECHHTKMQTPPVMVVPPGFDADSNKDTVDQGKEKLFANYKIAKGANSRLLDNGNALMVPKRSIVLVSDTYREILERKGNFNGEEWIPVQVLSTPPENTKLEESSAAGAQKIAKYPYSQTLSDHRDVEYAQKGSLGLLRAADLEKTDDQKNYSFLVKHDSELFQGLNDYFAKKGLKAFEPYALKMKHDESGYSVNQCCSTTTKRCSSYPIFHILNVRDKNGNRVEVPIEANCFTCQNNVFSSIVPVPDYQVNPLRSILAHPTLGLPENSNDFAKMASIAHLNFVDSRGFVQIPLTGNGAQRSGPYNSTHYSPESGDGDVYVKPDVACGFIELLKAWNKLHPGGVEGSRIEFGNASHAFYKNRSSKWGHVGHANGECIDIDTLRLNPNNFSALVNLLKKTGSGMCISSIQDLIRAGCNDIQHMSDPDGELHKEHRNHVHVCFPSNGSSYGTSSPKNVKLKQACEQGVSP